MSAVSNTVFVISETSSTLSKENDSEKKVAYNTATRKIIIPTFNLPALRKNRQSMTARGYCCCYLEHCSKTNHIAIKGVIQQAKYENVLDL